MALATALTVASTSAQAGVFYWDTDGSAGGNSIDGMGLGGAGDWDLVTSNWWNLATLGIWPNTNLDHAIFTEAYAAGAPVAKAVTLSPGIIANKLSFLRSGFTLGGGTLSLAGTTPTLHVNLGESATINSLIEGTDGLTKTGGGMIRLASGNTYTGTTTIANGALVITNQSALGADTSAVVVTGFSPTIGSTTTRSFGGGSLVVDGTGGDVNISRDLSLQGHGSIADRSAALISTGNNTLSGTVTMGAPFSGTNISTRIIAADGTLNLTGPLNILGTAAATISNLGGVNQAGASFYNVTGVLAGTGTLEGSGGGTLFLNPSDSSGFSGTIRVSGSAASGQSVVRIDSPGVLGTRTAGTTGAVLDLNGGILAVLMDSPDVKVSNGSNANVYFRGSSTIFADHTPGSSVKDQTVAFGNMSFEDNITLTFNSRNGYGMSFTTAPVNGGDANATLTNNLQGGALLSFTGNFWSNSNNTGNRTMTIGGNGNTTINGNIIASAAAFNHSLTKTGNGTLTLTGTASTLDGSVNVNGGTVAVSDWRAITNNNSTVNIGTGTTSATLAIVGNNATLTNLTTSKVINLAGTTGGATILANQTGTSPGVILNANFTASGAGAKTLTLGGTNIGANTINGAIVNSTSNTAVTKIDGGRWVLAGTNLYTGNTTISNGTLQLLANAAASTILADTSGINFAATNNFAGGTLEFIGQASTDNVETLGAITYAAGGAATIKLTPGSGGTASLIFPNISTGAGGTINFVGGDFTNNKFTLTQVNAAAGSDGIITRSIYWNGADFAYRQGGVLRAPVYGVDPGTVTSGIALAAGHNEITGSFATNSISVSTLKINGGHTLTVNDGQTLTLSGLGLLATGGSSTITGGTSLTVGGTNALVVRVDGGADSLRIETPLAGFSGGLTKSGAGTLVLAGANTQTGTVNIAEGTVRLSGGTLGGAAALNIRQDAVLELNGVTPSNINAFNNNGIVRNTSATTDVTFTVGGANGTGTSFGIIEDGGLAKINVVKLGTGGQTWNGLSTYTGTTTIDSTGIVTINNLQNGGSASGIGASSNAAANLIFTGTSAAQAYGGLNYAGTTNDETDRLFTFDGGVDGGVRIQSNGVNGATSSWTNTGALAFGANATGNAQGLVLGGASTGDNRFSPIINDNGGAVTSLYKVDGGVWYLMSTNGYSGATTLSGGTLYANDGTSLPTTSNVIFNGGNLATTGAFSRTIGTGSGQMQWGATASGGFSAGGSPLTVDWGSGNIWGTTAGFLGTGALLLNNSGVAKADVTITSSFDLGGGTRTVTVGDNTNIGADFATLSGNISGAAGSNLTKNGAGILNLRGANTYVGNTNVTQGTLVVETLGSSTSPAGTATSVGLSGNVTSFDDTNSINLGNGGTGGGILEYVGVGETSDRKIRLNSTTGGNQIHADGVGPLILTNVANDMTAGAKTLSLRGVNGGGNMITSQLSNNGGNLSVSIDGSAAWILTNAANDYSGTTSVGAGGLGIGADTALGTSTLVLSNGLIFAYGGDRTLTNAVQMGNNTGPGFMGDYSLTFTQPIQALATTSNLNSLFNNVAAGKTLTFGGATANDITSNRSWTFDGSGETIFTGNITTATAFGIPIIKTGDGILQLNGTGSNFNQANQNLDIDRGVLKIGANEVIPHGAGFGNVVLSPELANADTATLDLNGKNETINGLTANSDGNAVIDNTSATAASLTFGANDAAVSFGGGLGTYTIQNSGGGALSIIKTGTTAMTIPTGVTLTYTGATTVNGGSLTIASAVNGTTALNVLNGATMTLSGGLTAPAAVTSVVAESGSTLSLLDGAGNKLNALTTLQLGSVGGTTTTLNLNVGDVVLGDKLGTDTLTLTGSGTLSLFAGNTITFNLTDTGLNANQQYVLLDASLIGGGFFGGASPHPSIASYILAGTPGGFTSMDITTNSTTNQIILTTGNLIVGTSWWNAGGAADTWNDVANWAITDKTGTIPAASIPGQGTDVVFIADNIVGGGPISTTLEQNFKVNSLTFEASTNPANTPVSVTIDPGAVATNRIEIAPQNATDGIEITAGGPATVNINTAVRLGANQTWGVADAASVLSLGGLRGEADVTKTGAGKVTLTGAADSTFNGGDTADVTITAGTLEMTNVAALGDAINDNFATVTINTGGAFYFNNATSSTATNLAMPITLAGGTLSAGGNTQTYSGPVNVSASSNINMRNNNGGIGETQERSITLSGPLTGSGDLVINSDVTLSSGNAISGTLTLNNAANSWTGDLFFNQGTVAIANAASPSFTTNDVTFNSFGRLNLEGLNGATLTRTGTLTYAAGAIGEFGVNNTGAVVNADFLVDQNGAVTLGAGGTGASVRLLLSDAFSKMDITGAVTLGGNSSISVAGGDADSLVTISSVISDGGGAYSLAVNDDAGGWNQTNTILRLTGANSFSGNVTLASGVLEFDTVTNISGGASSLGNGTAISVGAATLRFIGASPQSTDRPITQTGSTTYSANGVTAADIITYSGPIDAAANNFTLTGVAGRAGFITGGINQTGDAGDATVNGGTWSHTTGSSRIGDGFTITGADTIVNLNSGLFQVRNDVFVIGDSNLNLNGTGVLSFSTATLSADASLRAYTGGTITLGANDAVVLSDFDGLRIGTDGAGVGTLDMGTFNQSTNEFILGNRNLDRDGIVNGTGTLTVLGNLDLYSGTINANLASTGTNTFEKIGAGTVVLRGNNSGLASTGVTIVYDGLLSLDYTASNFTKLNAASQLDMRGARVNVIGNNGAGTAQSVASLTLGSGGSSTIQVTGGTGQEAVLNLGAITRGNLASDGTIRFILPSGTQSVTNGITTTSPNSTFGMLGTGATATSDAAYGTVEDGSGTWFATKNTAGVGLGNIVALASTPKNDVTTWALGDHVTDETTGFTGVLQSANINSLRFNAAGGSDVVMPQAGILNIGSGGFLITSSMGGTPSLTGGTLASGATELVITQDSTQRFEIGSDIRVNMGVTKTGTGTLLLSGNNVYTGLTDIQEGVLQVSGNSIGDTSLVSLANSRNSSLELLASETIGRLSGGGRNTDGDYGIVAVGTHTLTINNTGSNTTYAGFFTGTGNIIKQGTNNLNLSNLSTGFTGILTVESGMLQMNGLGQINANIIRINKGGAMIFDNIGTTAPSTARILDAATITLNSADGTFQGQTIVRGLAIRNDNDATRDETVGLITLNTGASYVGMEATSTSDDSDIIINDLVRLNNATLNVRGTNLGGSSSQENEFRIGDATNQTAFIANPANLVGGGGAAASQNISIVPWAIGESTPGALAVTHMSNSLVTYVSGPGFRPLSFAEYNTFGSQVLPTDNIRESLAGPLALASGPAKTVNALVLHNASVAEATHAVTGAGVGESLVVTSGALLFTLDPAAVAGNYGITLGGFDAGITVGATNEYVISVVNPDAGVPTKALTATISSPLASAADITKSGRGTLVLSSTNTAGGGANRTTINEGILEIADLDNIGGPTGALVFAGGTLRLSSVYSGDDLSQRTISLLDGGGTIDTNGLDLALANTVGTGLGGLTKVGGGNLTLGAAATYTGATSVTAGTLTVGANNATGNGGSLSIGAGATLALGANSITAGLVSTSGASPAITGAGTINASTGFFFSNTGDMTVDAILAGPGGLFKNQTNVLTLAGLSTYTGTTEIQSGTLSFNSIGNAGGGASALGAAGNVEDGIIRMGLTTTATALTYTGSGHSSNRIVALQGTTGGVTINADGTGAVTFGGAQGEFAGAKTLTLAGTAASGLNNGIGEIRNGAATIALLKSGASTWELTQGNGYTGATSVNEGILRVVAGQNMSGALQFGSANNIVTAGTLEVKENATFGSLLAQTNSGVNTSILEIDATKTLTINGNVTLGSSGATTVTLFNASGAGSFVVNNPTPTGVTFLVGNSNTNIATADFSGLSTMNVSLNPTAGILQVGSTSTTNSTGFGTLILADDTTVTASAIAVGGGGSYNGNDNQVNALRLGATANVFNVNAFNIGTGNRDFGSVVFDTATGTLTLRAADGLGRAAFNMGTTGGGTGVGTAAGVQNTFDVTGHNADLLLGAVAMGTQSTRGDTLTNVFSFDTGILDMTSLTMSVKTGTGLTGSKIVNSTVNLGGGIVNIGTIAQMGQTSTTGNIGNATINVTGGDVTIGTGTGTAITMASAGTGTTATALLNITGGDTTVTGDIIRGGGGGTENATVSLAGGALDLSGFAIGSISAPVTLQAQSGTLSSLAQLNGGATFTKSTAGNLVMAGTNAYTGPTTVTGGTLNVTGSINGTANVQLDNTGTLLLSGAAGEQINNAAPVTLNGGTLGFNDIANQIETLGALTLSANSVVDFGLGGGNDTLFFDGGLSPGLLSHAAGTTLTIQNWIGNPSGGMNGLDDRLIFSGNSSDFTSVFDQVDVTFGGIGSGYAAISFVGGYEIVPVPEPSSTALLGAAGLLALVGYRERRRLLGAKFRNK